MIELLDPTNDYVFKRLFSEAPDLLADLINDLRPDPPAITSVQILNPDIESTDLVSRHITFDVLARGRAEPGCRMAISCGVEKGKNPQFSSALTQ